MLEVCGYGYPQQVRERRPSHPERHDRQAGHEHHNRPGGPVRVRGDEEVICELAAAEARRQSSTGGRTPGRSPRLRRGRVTHRAHTPHTPRRRPGVIAGVEAGAVCDPRERVDPHIPPSPTHPDQTVTAAGQRSGPAASASGRSPLSRVDDPQMPVPEWV